VLKKRGWNQKEQREKPHRFLYFRGFIFQLVFGSARRYQMEMKMNGALQNTSTQVLLGSVAANALIDKAGTVQIILAVIANFSCLKFGEVIANLRYSS